MEIPQREAAAEAEGWTSFCQTAKPWAGKELPWKIPFSEDAKLS